MTIHEELAAELRDAMRAADKPRRDVIRQIETEVTVVRSAPGFSGAVSDATYVEVMSSYSKKMQKSIEEYRGFGERGAAMADKLEWEVDYLARWLPTKLDEAATRALVESAVTELGVAGDEKAAGRVVGHLMKAHKDDLDGGLVNRVVREVLAG